MTHNLQIALQWAAAGAAVFPVEIVATAKGVEKKPRIKWRDNSTTESEIIRKWWGMWPDSVTGIDLAKTGLVVLDGDRHGGPDGVEALSQLFKEHRLDASAIPMVVTQGHGRHAWFKQPTDVDPLGNRDKAVRDAGINVRGHGGFVVAPGSRLSNGGDYIRLPGTPSTLESFKNGSIPILPPALVELLRAPKAPQQTNNILPPSGSREQSYAEAALRNQANALAAMPPESGRNNELNTAALKLGHQVAAGRIDQAAVEQALYRASEANGLIRDTSPSAVRNTISSGLKAGMTEPSPPLRDRPRNGGARMATLAENTEELLSICAANVKMKVITWLWQGRFAIGKLGLIVGLPDEGKGQTLCYIISQVTTGGAWPMNEGFCPQGNVLIFSDEDDAADTLVPRLAAAGADLERVEIIRMVKSEKRERVFSLVDDLPLLEKKIEEIEEKRGPVKLLVIDPVSAYLGVKQIDSFRTSDVRAVLTPLIVLAARKRVAIIGVMHFNKKVDVTNALLRISDSLAFGAVARHVYGIIDDVENDRKLFVRAKNNVAARAANNTLAYRFGLRDVGIDDETNEKISAPYILWEPNYVDVTAVEAMQAVVDNRSLSAKDEARKIITDLLAAKGVAPSTEIEEAAEANGISARTLRRARGELGIIVEKDRRTADGKWYWEMPPGGTVRRWNEEADKEVP
jgi:hypothetical protein